MVNTVKITETGFVYFFGSHLYINQVRVLGCVPEVGYLCKKALTSNSPQRNQSECLEVMAGSKLQCTAIIFQSAEKVSKLVLFEVVDLRVVDGRVSVENGGGLTIVLGACADVFAEIWKRKNNKTVGI